MNKLFGHLENVVVYLDDICIFTETEKQHQQVLEKVFNILRKNNIKLVLHNCEFFKREITFLGRVISSKGIEPEPAYLEKLLGLPRPTNKKEIQRFLGMVNWINKFIMNLHSVTYHLNELRKINVPFTWTHEHETEFKALRKKILQITLLKNPDASKPFLIYTDASMHGIGAVLLQKLPDDKYYPIQFLSKKFHETQRRWYASEQEMYTAVYAIKKWRHYLLLRDFSLFTDHRNLQFLCNVPKTEQSVRLRRGQYN